MLSECEGVGLVRTEPNRIKVTTEFQAKHYSASRRSKEGILQDASHLPVDTVAIRSSLLTGHPAMLLEDKIPPCAV
jgi:hypothetical protein